jgi:hypothetical protein
VYKRQVETLIESWENNKWNTSAKIEYTSDATGNILEEKALASSGAFWVNDSRKTYTYDENGNALSGKTETCESGAWKPDLASSYIYHKKEYILIIDMQVYRYTASYRGFPLGIASHKSPDFSIYPNPATDFLCIRNIPATTGNNEIRICNMQGSTLRTLLSCDNEVKLNLQGLAAGQYLVVIKTPGGITSKLLIVQ